MPIPIVANVTTSLLDTPNFENVLAPLSRGITHLLGALILDTCMYLLFYFYILHIILLYYLYHFLYAFMCVCVFLYLFVCLFVSIIYSLQYLVKWVAS